MDIIHNHWNTRREFAEIQDSLIDHMGLAFKADSEIESIVKPPMLLRGLFQSFSLIEDDDLQRHSMEFLAGATEYIAEIMMLQSLPPGDEHLEQKIQSTLKLMSYKKGQTHGADFVRLSIKFCCNNSLTYISCTN